MSNIISHVCDRTGSAKCDIVSVSPFSHSTKRILLCVEILAFFLFSLAPSFGVSDHLTTVTSYRTASRQIALKHYTGWRRKTRKFEVDYEIPPRGQVPSARGFVTLKRLVRL
jgi:hypothetical protein